MIGAMIPSSTSHSCNVLVGAAQINRTSHLAKRHLVGHKSARDGCQGDFALAN